MPTYSQDPNTKKIVDEIKDVNRNLHELVRVVKAGLGVVPAGPVAVEHPATVVADRIPVRLDWVAPAVQAKATIVQSNGKAQILIDVDPEDVVVFLNSVHRESPELLLVSSMALESGV